MPPCSKLRLVRADELLFYRLATLHNLTYILDFMAAIRSSIAAGSFNRLVSAHASAA